MAQRESGQHGHQKCTPNTLSSIEWIFLNDGLRPPQDYSDSMKMVSLEESGMEGEGPGTQLVVEGIFCPKSRGEGSRRIVFQWHSI